MTTRRELLSTLGAAGAAALGAGFAAPAHVRATEAAAGGKALRIGVISARIEGKPQPLNGHTWHFAQYFHPQINLDAVARHDGPNTVKYYEFMRNPQHSFSVLPFPDTAITQYYEADPAIAANFAEAFPGVQVATSLEQMANEVDAVWLGDASGKGEDHFDLIAPALAAGLPTFCDKPIGGSVAGTRKILEFARRHNAPIMSSSLFRHEWGTEEALRMIASGDFGELQYVIASMYAAYSPEGWLVYGQHPAWTIMTLCGSGVAAVSAYAREGTCHALVTYRDRHPAEIWYGRPDISGEYCRTTVAFARQTYEYTAGIEGNFWMGHHYEMFNMANAFRNMVKTGVEPVPHQEILEVTAMIHAGVKSLQERSRLVELAEVMA